jgi:pimeloyl-ACP methyl ester carboxylesterase
MKVFIYKVGKLAAKLAGISPDKYAARHGSSDYQKAGSLRGTLISVVNENLKEEARQITCPVLLLYGDKDTETPMQIGKDYNQLISLSEMVSLDGQDHYSVLGDGRHTVAALIKTFVEKQRT